MGKQKNILVCPLNWGLGHASRDIPIIRFLLKNNFKVYIAGDGHPFKLLKTEFQECPFIHLPSFKIKYNKKGILFYALLFQIPGFICSVIREHCHLKKIVKKYNIDIVISDNRYGLWNRHAYAVFITHQLYMKFPRKIKFSEPLAHRFCRYFILKYDSCWIPDTGNNNENLSGSLSHNNKLQYHNIKYIGLLSRFKLMDHQSIKTEEKILVILSGPEPQRTKLEILLKKQLTHIPFPVILIRGMPGDCINKILEDNLILYGHLPANEFYKLLLSSKYVICRAGYSMIMDLVSTGKTAILIPTPGQTEQEYLADYLSEKKLFVKAEQDHLDIKRSLKELSDLKVPDFNLDKTDFRDIIYTEPFFK